MFAERRRRFMEKMEGGVAVIFAAPERTRSNDTNHRFRQDSDFQYLTGFPEPDAAAVILPGSEEHDFILFVRDRNKERETWDGRRFGPEGAKEHFEADAAYPIEHLDELLPVYLEDATGLYYSLGRYPDRDALVMAAMADVKKKVRLGIGAPHGILDPSAILNEMRLFKSPDEVELMRRAAVISCEAHREAMRTLRPGVHEYEIEAVIEYVFRRRGAVAPAYATIAGGGRNAAILHYTENTDVCRDGDLLLVDAGCEYQGYAADITRTFPVNGTFSPLQRDVYQVVLDAQVKAVDAVRLGRTFDDVHQTALRRLVEGLVDLKILGGSVDKIIEDESYKPYYMHRTGHWLGLDVHDVGDYRKGKDWRALEAGMVLTVEPGLYFAEDDTSVTEEFRGLGIRIEDDVLVTAGDPDVLTREAPKTVEEVEAVMAEAAEAVL